MIPTKAWGPTERLIPAYQVSAIKVAYELWSYLGIKHTKSVRYACVKVPIGSIERMFSGKSWQVHFNYLYGWVNDHGK